MTDAVALAQRFPPAYDRTTHRAVTACPRCGRRLLGPSTDYRGSAYRSMCGSGYHYHTVYWTPHAFMRRDWDSPITIWLPIDNPHLPKVDSAT